MDIVMKTLDIMGNKITGDSDTFRRDAHHAKPWASRAVVVVGSGV